MKPSFKFLSFIFTLFTFSAFTANAAPVQYQMAATIVTQGYWEPLLPPSEYPLPLATKLTATFLYDSSTPMEASGHAAGAITNFVGSWGSYQFATPSTDMISCGVGIGCVSILIGSDDPEYQGFTANGMTLSSENFTFMMNNDGQLPSVLVINPNSVSVLTFTAANQVDQYHFWALIDNVSEVPLPSTLWLFGSSVIGLIVTARSRSAQRNRIR
jgi:hypothetical protein